MYLMVTPPSDTYRFNPLTSDQRTPPSDTYRFNPLTSDQRTPPSDTYRFNPLTSDQRTPIYLMVVFFDMMLED
jgi:hypothetical protein